MNGNDKKLLDVCSKFNSHISKIIKLIEPKCKGDEEFRRVKGLVTIAKNESPLALINECKDKIWDTRTHIMNKDEKFFMVNSFDKYYQEEDDSDRKLIEHILEKAKETFQTLSQREKNYIWDYCKVMLDMVCEYKMLIQDHD